MDGKSNQYNRAYILANAVLALLVLWLVNHFITRLPERWLRQDVSQSGIFTLSTQSRDLLQQLQIPVTIYLVCTHGQEDSRLQQLLAVYADGSDWLTLSSVDPALDPSFVPRYTSGQIADNSLIVEADGRSRVILQRQIYVNEYDYDSGSVRTRFDGEGQITSALAYVQGGDTMQIALLTGHRESAWSDSFDAQLEKEMVSLTSCRLFNTAELSMSVGCVVLNAPQSDLLAQEADELLAYLQQGGKLLLLGYPSTSAPNLARVLDYYGLACRSGILREGDANYYIPGQPACLLPALLSHTVTLPQLENGDLLLMPDAQAIDIHSGLRATLAVQPLLLTSQRAYLQTDAEGRMNGVDAPFAIAAVAEEGDTRLVWINCGAALNETVDTIVGGTNQDMVLNCIAWLGGQAENVTLRPKALVQTPLHLTAAQAMTLSAVFAGGLPLLVLAIGLVVTVARKRRQ